MIGLFNPESIKLTSVFRIYKKRVVIISGDIIFSLPKNPEWNLLWL
jgi:hypothetical protein